MYTVKQFFVLAKKQCAKSLRRPLLRHTLNELQPSVQNTLRHHFKIKNGEIIVSDKPTSGHQFFYPTFPVCLPTDYF